MKRRVQFFTIMQGENIIDTFELFKSNTNHGTINNSRSCLFDGYYPEAYSEWERIKNDMKMVEMIGMKVQEGEQA